jgi:hypothetical protein
MNPPHQRTPVAPASQLLFNLTQKSLFAVILDRIDIDLIHARRPFVGLYPLPFLAQDVLPTSLIVEKREPPFRLLLCYSE